MNKPTLRDDSLKNRLSSFLREEANVKVKEIKHIKENIYLIKNSSDDLYILKGYKNRSTITQQWEFFEKSTSEYISTFTCFPNKRRTIQGFGLHWTWSRYIDGKSMQYSDSKDREDVWKLLQNFHKDSKGIELNNVAVRQPLYLKGYNRIKKLDITKPIMEQYGYESLFNQLKKLMVKQLTEFEQLDWHFFEKNAVDQQLWIHGDVASHNFLRTKENQVYVIDFDLLALSPPIYDYIQLGQRFLPFLHDDLNQLMRYCLWEDEKYIKAWLLGITLPTDIIREWWFFTRKKKTKQEHKQYLEKMTNEVTKRNQFVRQVENMLI